MEILFIILFCKGSGIDTCIVYEYLLRVDEDSRPVQKSANPDGGGATGNAAT